MSFDDNQNKSIFSTNRNVQYCARNSLRQHALQIELQEATIKFAPDGGMIGAPEVLQLLSNFIKLINAKRCLDVGTFTGASALAWALATGPDAQIHTMDVDDIHFENIGKPIIGKEPTLLNKIQMHKQAALQTLDDFLANGEEGKFDFAFIDADKENYPLYYEKCLSLLKVGGVIGIDNALMHGKVVEYDAGETSKCPEYVKYIHATNQLIHADNRVDCSLLTTGDGLMIAIKK